MKLNVAGKNIMKSSSHPVITLGMTFFLATSFITHLSMIAYDCGDKDSEISAVSISDVAECPETKTAYTIVNRELLKLFKGAKYLFNTL
ncbi:hypothetical protein JTB14_025404 [Gonioctena quinquepunctata]|nr:hypothetical protein JTB14_025404 [Gonioctena quinquepunctata]